MKLIPLIAAFAGLAVMSGLILHFGAGEIIQSLIAVGWEGFVAVALFHLVVIAVMGLAWWVLIPGDVPRRYRVFPVRICIWGRLVRDAAGELLPFSQVGGYLLGVRAVTLAGVAPTVATASTIVDVTLEFLAQLAFTAVGLVGLVLLRPDSEFALPVAIGLAIAGVGGGVFILAQRKSFDLLGRMARELGRGWADRTADGAQAVHRAIAHIYARPAALAWSTLLHFGCWIASAFEAWLLLWFADTPLGFAEIIVIESLLYAIRTAAFVVPNAVGVQEGAYILLGAAFGLTPETALALSLLKRGRDLVTGLPALGAWQLVESGRLWRGRNPRSLVDAECE
jgi:putative membrane protein